MADAETVREARARYFAESGFDDSGYTARWVKLKAGPFLFWFPNTPSRRRAVRYHDLHHVATGYRTTWIGEAEIGAFEVASGCADHWAAWILNLQAMSLGLLLAPARTFRAFVRGRHAKNLYREPFGDALLEETVASLRARLSLDRPPPPPTTADRVAFVFWSEVAAASGLAALAAVLVPPLALAALGWWLVA